jgi:hypothetical protein
VFLETEPGSPVLQPYIALETLYSTSKTSTDQIGLGGRPNPWPTVDVENLPFQSAQSTNDPRSRVRIAPSGAVIQEGVAPAEGPAGDRPHGGPAMDGVPPGQVAAPRNDPGVAEPNPDRR